MNIVFHTNGNEKQKEAARYWADGVTEQILYGGAKYGGKSFLGANLIFGDAMMYPGTNYFIARQSLTDLRKYTIPTIHEVFAYWGLKMQIYATYNGQDNFYQLYNGSKVFLLDAKYLPSDPDYHRFGSIQMTRGWCEEIGEMHAKAINNLFLTVGRWRNKDYGLKKKLLLTCNPHKGYGYTYFYKPAQSGTLGKSKKFIVALPQDNKSGDPDYIESLINNPDKVERERLAFGNWEYDDDPATMIEYDAIMDLWTNDYLEGGSTYMTVDVARLGNDRTVICIWKGWRLIHVEWHQGKDLNVTAQRCDELEKRFNVPRSRQIADEDGVGGGLIDMRRMKGFVNNSRAISGNYQNLKSQCSFFLADKINDREMYIGIEDTFVREQLSEELEYLKRKDPDSDGKLAVMRKQDEKDVLGRSPDFRDAVMMRAWFDLSKGEVLAHG